MTNLRAKIISNFIFIINPTLWFPLGIFEVLSNSRQWFIKLSIFISIIGFSLFPWGDGYERYKVFLTAEYLDFSEFTFNGLMQGDIVFYVISYLVSSAGLSYQFVQLLFVLLGYLTIFSSLRYMLVDVNQKERLVMIILVLLLVNIIGLANNLRYMLATIFFLQAIFFLEYLGYKVRFLFFASLAGLTHFYAFFLLVIYFFISISSVFFNRRMIRLLLLFCLFFSFTSPPAIQLFASLISQSDGLISRKFASYILGGDGIITKMISSPSQFINHFIKQLPLFLLVFYFVRFGDFHCKRTKVFIIFFCFTLTLAYFFSIYLRLSYFCLLYGLWLFMIKWKCSRPKATWVYFLLFFSCGYSVLNIVYFQRIMEKDGVYIINQNTFCAMVLPVIFIDRCSFSDVEIYEGNEEFRTIKMESLQRTMKAIEQ